MEGIGPICKPKGGVTEKIKGGGRGQTNYVFHLLYIVYLSPIFS